MSPTLAISFSFPSSSVTTAILSAFIIAVLTGSVSSLFAYAIFVISPVIFSFTVTLNVSSIVAFPSMSTVHIKPFPIFVASLSAEFSTYVVFAGIISFTSTFDILFSVLFVTVIVYKISPPALTTFSPDVVVAFLEIDILPLLLSVFILSDIFVATNSIGVHPIKLPSNVFLSGTSTVSILSIVAS